MQGFVRNAYGFAALISKAGIANATMPPASTNGSERALRLAPQALELGIVEQAAKRPHTGALGRHQCVDRREAHRALALHDARIGDARARAQRAQRSRIAEHERCTERIGNTLAEQPLEQRRERRVAGRVLERIANRHGKAAAGPQHALHLAQRGDTIVEEHQAELADDRVEARVGERQRLGAAVVPFDVRHACAEPPPASRGWHRVRAPRHPARRDLPPQRSTRRCHTRRRARAGPTAMFAASHSTGPQCLNSAGTNCSSYTSAGERTASSVRAVRVLLMACSFSARSCA